MRGMKSWFGYKEKKAPGKAVAKVLSPEDNPDTIHIFTIASGHMYERLQKIMILSLIRNTKYAHPLNINKVLAVTFTLWSTFWGLDRLEYICVSFGKTLLEIV